VYLAHKLLWVADIPQWSPAPHRNHQGYYKVLCELWQMACHDEAQADALPYKNRRLRCEDFYENGKKYFYWQRKWGN
jgi:hypothetical protein